MKTLTYLLGVLIVAVMIAYLSTQRDLIQSLRSITFPALVIVIVLSICSAAVNGTQFGRMCKVFGVTLTYPEALGLAVTNTMLNYAIPLRGGLIMRAAYMKQRFGLSYTNYGALLASSQLLAVASAALAGLTFSGLSLTLDGIASIGLTLFFALTVVGSLVAYRIVEWFDFTRLRPEVVGRRIQSFSLGFSEWRRHPRLTAEYGATVAGAVVVYGVRLFVIFRALGAETPFAPLMVITAAVVVSGALSITPGNLGIREAATTLSASLLGIDARLALLASLVDRAAGLVVTVAMGLGFSQTLLRGWTRQRGVPDPDAELEA